MPAFRAVVSVLVSFVVRSFSTNSRPALRAAACGGRPRPAALIPAGGLLLHCDRPAIATGPLARHDGYSTASSG